MHPCLADKALTHRVRQLQAAALSPATKQAYATGSKRYKAFCKKYRISPFPTTQLTLCYFAAYLSSQVQYATVRLYIAAVRAEQLGRGLADPLKEAQQLTLLLRGLNRHAQTQAKAPNQSKTASATDSVNLEHERYMQAGQVSLRNSHFLSILWMLKSRRTFISISSFIQLQATPNCEGYHNPQQHSAAMDQAQQDGSVWQGCDNHHRSIQNRHLPGANHATVPTLQEACTQHRCTIPLSGRLPAN